MVIISNSVPFDESNLPQIIIVIIIIIIIVIVIVIVIIIIISSSSIIIIIISITPALDPLWGWIGRKLVFRPHFRQNTGYE